MTPYTIDFFIEKFEAIPEERWTVGQAFNRETGQFCAMGFCSDCYYNLMDNYATIRFGETREVDALCNNYMEASMIKKMIKKPVG